MRILLCCCVILIQVCISHSVFSQKALQLTNNQSGKKKYLEAGQRVEYVLNSTGRKHKVGILESVSDSVLSIQGVAIPLHDIKSIGRRRKGSGFWAFTTSFIATGLLIDAGTPDPDPCPDCEDSGSSGDGTGIEIGMSLVFIALCINTVDRNSPKDVVKKWMLEVIDASAVPAKKK